MKLIIIGLGSFGGYLGERLTAKGHEVIGVDHKMEKVEALKEKLTHTVCLDCTNPQAVTHLPLGDTDVVVVCIGENEGANLMATALMKRHKVKRLISRAVSPLHETILEAMEVDEVVQPEEESADRWAKRLNLKGLVDSFDLADDFSIVEAMVPQKFVGKTLREVDFNKNFNVLVLTTIKQHEEKNLLGISRKVSRVQGVASSSTRLEDQDILVMYGNTGDIEKLIKAE